MGSKDERGDRVTVFAGFNLARIGARSSRRIDQVKKRQLCLIDSCRAVPGQM